MQRSFEAYLWDVKDSGDFILEVTAAKTEENYAQDRLLRNAVERNFEIIGEALSQAKRSFPADIERINDYTRVIAFRNELAHGYDGLNHHEVWKVIQNSLPHLLAQISNLLAATPPRI